ncbi:MAG: hypothetical protein P1P69_04135 [Methanosarcinaceae archaeon]|nr:hypothetical protein [Methanosarcinaceae archaeon]
MINKMMMSIKGWVEFYLDKSVLSEQTKDSIRKFIVRIAEPKE